MEKKKNSSFLYMMLMCLIIVGASVFLCIYSKWNPFAIVALVISILVTIYLGVMSIITSLKKKNDNK